MHCGLIAVEFFVPLVLKEKERKGKKKETEQSSPDWSVVVAPNQKENPESSETLF